MFNLMEELFSPGRKHTDDEQRRLEHTRVEEGSTDPGKGPIDLASGQVLIRPPGQRTDPEPEPARHPEAEWTPEVRPEPGSAQSR
ncbi:DUF6191 domain-containing protein [Streptomyces spirodelae]|uniref:DUF6191 domain-containing protein n=1 Tax=Streptomyces spirodelae TaxID=2812904 RepID=UPI0027DCE7A9|nr:DUF6191 domain-containing protein [Streptomyces spirodelae]